MKYDSNSNKPKRIITIINITYPLELFRAIFNEKKKREKYYMAHGMIFHSFRIRFQMKILFFELVNMVYIFVFPFMKFYPLEI